MQWRESISCKQVSITKNFPSGVSGNIRCYVAGNTAFLQFDGFNITSTTWLNGIVTGLPVPIAAAWMIANSDAAGPVKVSVTTNGSCNIRATQNGGTNHYVDDIVCYPIA